MFINIFEPRQYAIGAIDSTYNYMHVNWIDRNVKDGCWDKTIGTAMIGDV